MLYLYYGPDNKTAREKAHAAIQSCLLKKPGADIFRLTADAWNEKSIDELIGGQGLFERKFIVFCDGLLGNKEIAETIMPKMKIIGESDNVFIFLEDELTKEILRKIEKSSAKIQESRPKKEIVKKTAFNIFDLADAVGERNRKKLWTLYLAARKEGVEPEQIHGILFWEAKALIVAMQSRTAEEAGQKPFVFSKAKRYAENWKPEKLAKLSETLIKMYHDAHLGLTDFDVALERFALTV